VDRRGGPEEPAAALRDRRREAVILGVDGISDFDALHSRKHEALNFFRTSWHSTPTGMPLPSYQVKIMRMQVA
jgi:hypothetical protein